MAEKDFAASDIVVLSGLEAVRRNPWMYVGSVSQAGVHQLLCELVYNSVDEALAGACSRIEVALGKDRCAVKDDGRGIPTELHPKEGIPACEVALTRLHSGSKFSRNSHGFSAGLHGVGLSCVNALSDRLKVEIRRKGHLHVQEFRRGEPSHALKALGAAAGRGTRIEFRPDRTIFKDFKGFDANACRRLLEDLSFLIPGTEFVLRSAGSKRETFRTESGIAGFLARLTHNARKLFPEPIAVRLASRGLRFQAVVQWTTDREPKIRSFVNCVDTVHGGAHVRALRAGLAEALERMMLETGKKSARDEPVEADEASEGLAVIVDLKLSHPNFEGQTKARLTNAAVCAPIRKAVSAQILAYLRGHPRAAAVIADKLLEVRRAKLAAKRTAEKIYFQRLEQNIDEEVYKEQFGARSKNWHESAAWITDQELLDSHAALCRQGKGAVALDVCCGSGVVGAAFKGRFKKVVGLDLTPEMIAMARTRLSAVRQGNVYDLPFKNAAFDLVCTREVLHLLPNPERPVAEIFRVLKPGGQFIVGQTLPFGEDDAPWMFRIFKKKQPLVFNMFQEEDFKRLLTGRGFVDLEMKELNVWESIDVWIDSPETTSLRRHEIRQLYRNAPAEAKAIHPFKILPSGEIQDLWRWGIFSVRKPRQHGRR
ncbi:MAG: hypothetical protein A2V88_03290 [Elusimicrobia bacterium RBG_16_66_12]|nr:MAG: hypothetical protein A2V88_03290 [Elusimicrobia bacterium RBG_16_66_12]